MVSWRRTVGCVVAASLVALSQQDDPSRHSFNANTRKVMDILSHNVYSDPNVFFRELISNASDALSKYREKALVDAKLQEGASKYEINVIGNEQESQITVVDTGIGMTKEEMIGHLGTIAKSGTADFQEEAKLGVDSDLIGKYGIGFYSAFVVADEVTVISKSPFDSKQHIWKSSNDGTFTIAEDLGEERLPHGTKIVLSLKGSCKDYAKQANLESFITKYSNFVLYPINLWTEKTVEETVDLTPAEIEELRAKRAEEKAKAAEDKAQKEKEKQAKAAEREAAKAAGQEAPEEAEAEEEESQDGKEGEEKEGEEKEGEKEATTKKVSKTVHEFVQVNTPKPIWKRNASEVAEAEYNDFFKTLTKEKSLPLAYSHFKVEGTDFNFSGLLYISDGPRYNPMDPSDLKNKKKISLYVKNVFITDSITESLPSYLGFVTGVIDSNEFQLNVSRESVQNLEKVVASIKKHIVNKILSMVKALAHDSPKKYETFWRHYSTTIKYGIKDDSANKEKLAELLRFYTSYRPEGLAADKFHVTSLAEYLERCKEKQKSIFFAVGPSPAEMLKSPFAEGPLSLGYEVLLFEEPFDQYVAKTLSEYKEKKFQDIAEGDLDLGEETEEDKKSLDALKEEFKALSDWLVKLLDTEVDAVNISKKLSRSPMAVTSKNFGMTGYMMKVMAAQSGSKENPYLSFMTSMKKSVEINPKHPIIVALNERAKSDTLDENTKAMARILFDAAMVSSGFDLKDTTSMMNNVDRILRRAFNLELPKEEPKAEAKADAPAAGDAASPAEEAKGGDEDEDEDEAKAEHDDL